MTTTTIPAANEILDAARDAVPGFTSSVKRRERLAAWADRPAVRIQPQLVDARNELAAAVARVADGETEDLRAYAQRIVDLEAEQVILGLVAAEVDRVTTALPVTSGISSRLDAAGQNAAMRYLDGVLQELVREVRALDAVLSGVTDAAAAFGSGRATEWGRLLELVDVYDAIRAAQVKLLLGSGIQMDKLLRSGLLADAIDRERAWVIRRIRGGAGATLNKQADVDAAAWLVPEGLQQQVPFEAAPTAESWWPAETSILPDFIGGSQKPEADRPRFLRWVCVNAHPWVPTPNKLEEAYAAATIATGGIGPGTIRAARAYFEATGTESIAPLPPTSDDAGPTKLGSARGAYNKTLAGNDPRFAN